MEIIAHCQRKLPRWTRSAPTYPNVDPRGTRKYEQQHQTCYWCKTRFNTRPANAGSTLRKVGPSRFVTLKTFWKVYARQQKAKGWGRGRRFFAWTACWLSLCTRISNSHLSGLTKVVSHDLNSGKNERNVHYVKNMTRWAFPSFISDSLVLFLSEVNQEMRRCAHATGTKWALKDAVTVDDSRWEKNEYLWLMNYHKNLTAQIVKQ